MTLPPPFAWCIQVRFVEAALVQKFDGSGATLAPSNSCTAAAMEGLQAGLLSPQNRMRIEIKLEMDKVKATIDEKVGGIVTGINSQMQEVERAMRDLDSKGQAIVEIIDKQKAEVTTQVQQIMADAGSEFEKHKTVINAVAADVDTTKKEIVSMTTGLREELDAIRSSIQALGSSTDSGGSAAAARGEMDGMRAELVNLRASLVSGGPAAASQGAGGKLGGFILWKI